MMMKPAFVTTLSLVSPHVPSPPSCSEASASGALERENPEREQRRTDHGSEDTYPHRRWLSSSLPISPRTWRASRFCAGRLLLKLERRDRMTLSGRNGSGKTTLLRMLSGETGIDGGDAFVFAKDVRVSLHDQRPPRDRDLTLRDYVFSGCKELLALEDELARLEAAMADGAMDDGHLHRLRHGPGAARARRGLQLARGRELHAARAGLP